MIDGIKNLQLRSLRSHDNVDYIFDEYMNAIVGPNGSGKTTILEAIYCLLMGTSFRGTIGEMAKYGSSQFKIQLDYVTKESSHKRCLLFTQNEETSMKKWKINEKSYARLPLSARLPVVLFEPELSRLISGGPARRRLYLDALTSQLNLEVAFAQKKFERTLKQRNNLLKQMRTSTISQNESELFIWDTQLAHLSETIVNARFEVIDLIQQKISKYYKDLGGSDEIFISYQSTTSLQPKIYSSKMLQFLQASHKRDIVLGYTSFGPHRDDFQIHIADQPAEDRASRGEVRTIVIALKLIETELLSKHYEHLNIKPILLLDDVLSELDLVHQEKILSGLKDHQVFITTTDAHAISAGVHTIALD